MPRFEVKTASDFLRRIAVELIPHGYVFYVQGEIPCGKDPSNTDKKIIRQYEIALSKWTRVRRKRKGIARIQYVRFKHAFVILATEGVHPFFQQERNCVRDLRRQPLRVCGFAITSKYGQVEIKLIR